MSDPQAQPKDSFSEGFSSSEPLTNTSPESLSSGEQAGGIRPSRWEAFAEALSHGFDTGATGSLVRMDVESTAREEDSRQGVTKLTPDQANERFPGLPVPFNENVSPREAQIKFDLYQRDRKAEDWISRGSKSPYSLDRLAAGVVTGFADPVNIALGLATGEVSTALGAANTLRNVFLQNLAVNSLTGGLNYYQQKQDQRNPSAEDEVIGAVTGAVGGTAFHYGLQYLNNWLRGASRELRATPRDIQEQNLKMAIGQEEAGAKIDTSLGDSEAMQRRSVAYNTETIPQNIHYVGVTADGKFVAQDPNLGPGVQTSNNGHLMNNLASDTMGGGHVGQLKIPEDAKFFNIDQPAITEYGKEDSFLKAFERETGVELKPQEGESIKDVIDRFHSMSTDDQAWHEVMTKAQDALKAEGYLGYEFNGTDAQGRPTDARKHLFLADNRLTAGQDRLSPLQLADERVQPGEGYQANEAMVPQTSADEKAAHYQETTAPENSKYTSPELQEKVHDLRHGDAFNSQPDYMDPIVEEQIKNAKALLDKLAENDPSLKDELDEIYREHATADQQQQNVLKTLADCVVENMV